MEENKNKSNRDYWIKVVRSIKKHLDKPIKGSGYYIPFNEKAFILVAIQLLNDKFFDRSDLDEVLIKLQKKLNTEKHIYFKNLKEKKDEKNRS